VGLLQAYALYSKINLKYQFFTPLLVFNCNFLGWVASIC